MRVHHTGFTVRNLERAVGFFRDVLGLEVTPIHVPDDVLAQGLTGVSGASLRLAFAVGNGHQFELVEYSHAAGASDTDARPCNVGAGHAAFVVDDLDTTIAAVLAASGSFTGTPQLLPDGTRSVYMRSPDGIQMEFIQLPSP